MKLQGLSGRRACRARPAGRRLRIDFADRESLLCGFARAQQESWVDDCVADLERRTLEVRPVAGWSVSRRALEALRGGLPGLRAG